MVRLWKSSIVACVGFVVGAEAASSADAAVLAEVGAMPLPPSTIGAVADIVCGCRGGVCVTLS